MGRGPVSISAVVITYNEEANIERCLQSLSFVDEIVVVDSFSTDRTVEIARRYTDNVSQREFVGFSDQKNASIELATSEWLLAVDADEVVTPELAEEICSVLQNTGFDAYRVPRLTYFLGKPIRRCGWYPDFVVRIVRRSKARYGDRLVHESLMVDGPVGQLKKDLLHFSYNELDDVVRKMIGYSCKAARQKYIEGHRARLADLLFRPGLTFLKKYILQQGFRDGLRGFMICALSQCGVFLRYAALWEMSLRKEHYDCD